MKSGARDPELRTVISRASMENNAENWGRNSKTLSPN